eukprot:5241298-Amphidinium_carterae.3
MSPVSPDLCDIGCQGCQDERCVEGRYSKPEPSLADQHKLWSQQNVQRSPIPTTPQVPHERKVTASMRTSTRGSAKINVKMSPTTIILHGVHNASPESIEFVMIANENSLGVLRDGLAISNSHHAARRTMRC